MDKITAMREGGAHLREIKFKLQDFAQVGRTFLEVEVLATGLIKQVGAKPNFSLVPGYHWTTCINKNEGIVHGIPNQTVIESGDLISIDLGLIWHEWNLDVSISFIAGESTPEKDYFLAVGEKALAKATKQAVVGGTIYDLSRQIEKTITRSGFDPSYQLTGHFIGRQLHEDPLIPCVAQKSDRHHVLKAGDTLAIEVMYAQGSCDLELASDGWTYQTIDRSLTALWENTILVTSTGPEVLT
jgi:methionyl aminopeptidase